MKEIWKDIPNYDGYQVSNLGRIKSLPKKTNNQFNMKEIILKPIKQNNGYYLVNTKGKVWSVHRIVASIFIPNPNKLPQVNHIDGNKANNCVDNLEWCTCKDNINHAYKIGLKNGKRSKNNILSKPINQYDLNGIFIKRWYCTKDVERILKIYHGNISKCCKNKAKTAGGYIWRYANE